MPHPTPMPHEATPVLAAELATGELRRALFCHLQSRWYLGELFCHASWVASLARAGIEVSVCTNRHYLELFEHHPAVVALHPPEDLTPELIARHDLVVLTGTHRPTDHRPNIPLAVHAWNTGIAVTRYGRVEHEQPVHDTNHFAATSHRHGLTALPDGEYLSLHLTDREREAAERTLSVLLGDTDAPVTVLNPSASNALTRESHRPKAVDNLLDTDDYESLIRHLLDQLPGHRVLIGAPLKPDDHANHEATVRLAERFTGDGRVVCLTDTVTVAEGLSLRAFAAILSQAPVRHMVGNSTGSNTHLAATLDIPAVSIERAADDDIRANWRDTARGQMGSFRWRNNHPSAASYRLPWNDGGHARHHRAVACLTKWHTELREHGRRAAWLPSGPRAGAAASAFTSADPRTARDGMLSWQHSARGLAATLTPEQRAVYLDFHDEAEYLHTIGAPRPARLMDYLTALGRPAATQPVPVPVELTGPERNLVHSLTASSNLAKLAEVLGPSESRRG